MNTFYNKIGLTLALLFFFSYAALSQCTAPTNFSIGVITSNNAYVSWTGPSSATGYEYVLSQSTTQPTGSGTAIPGASVIVNSLASSTTYYLHVRSVCGTLLSGWNTTFFTTLQGVCPMPNSVTASAVTNTSATISWPAASGVSSYEYTIGASSGLPAGSGTPTTSLSVPATGLSAGNTYYAFVRSVCSGSNYSGWMYSSFVTTGTNTCPTPTGLAVSNITNSSANFNWNAVAGAIGYEYVLDFSPGNPLSASTPVTTNSFNLTGIANNTSFYFHVRAQCGTLSFGPWIDIPFTTTNTAGCTAPSAVSVGGITAASVNLSWPAVSGSSGYQYVVDNSVADPLGAGTPVAGTSVTAGGLTASTAYYAHVRSSCASGFSAWTTAPFTTNSTTACAAPSGLATGSVTTTTAALSWTAVTGSTGYEYVVDQIAGAPAGSGTPVTATAANASGLSPATGYYAHVRTKCNATTFSSWSTVPFTTLSATACDTAATLAISTASSTSANASWSAVSGATGYEYVVNQTAGNPSGAGTAVTASSVTVTALSTGATYYFHLRSKCGTSTFSAWKTKSFKAGATGIGNVAGAEGIRVMPNPTNGLLKVYLDQKPSGSAVIRLTNTTGVLVKSISVSSTQTEVDLQDLAPGLYFLRYTDNSTSAAIRIQKR